MARSTAGGPRAGALRKCGALAELRVGHNRLAALPAELAANARLKVLDAGHNRISRWEDISVLSELPFLFNVSLRGNPLSEARFPVARGGAGSPLTWWRQDLTAPHVMMCRMKAMRRG